MRNHHEARAQGALVEADPLAAVARHDGHALARGDPLALQCRAHLGGSFRDRGPGEIFPHARDRVVVAVSHGVRRGGHALGQAGRDRIGRCDGDGVGLAHAAELYARAQPLQGLGPERGLARGGEESEVADALRVALLGLQVQALHSRRAVERVHVIHGRARDDRVVVERIGTDRDLHAVERVSIGVAFGQQVLRMQAPLAPLPRHAARKVAHHAQALAGEVAEERRERRDGDEPEEAHPGRHAIVPLVVAGACRDGEGRLHIGVAGQHPEELAAQAVAHEGRAAAPGAAALASLQHRLQVAARPRRSRRPGHRAGGRAATSPCRDSRT